MNKRTAYRASVWDVMQLIFGKFNDHQLHCVIHFDGNIDEDCFRRAVDMSGDIFPIIRSKFVEKSYFRFPFWEDCKFTSQQMVNIIETEDVEKTIEKLIVSKTKETWGPQIMINLIRSRKCDSLCIIMNHMISDGSGFKEYLYMLSSIYSRLKNDPNYVMKMKMGSRSMKQVFKTFNLKDKIKILFDSTKLKEYDNGVKFQLEGDRSNPFIVTRKISRDRFLLIKNYVRSNAATLNDAFLSAYIRALVKVLKVTNITLPCPVDLRRYLPHKKAEGICNLTSNIVCNIGNDIGQTYDKTLLKVKEAMDMEKKNFSSLKGPLILEILFGILPYKRAKHLVEKFFVNPPIAMTNIGIIDKKKLIFGGLNIKDAFICGSIKYNPYFQVAITTFDNEVTLSINFCGTDNDKNKIKEFLTVFDKELPF